MERPDLSKLPPEVVAYIDYLEEQLEAQEVRAGPAASTEPSEQPTTMQLITISRMGQAKRTPRHLYSRQRRGGMGVFDLEMADDAPALLCHADLEDRLLLFSDLGRAFRVNVRDLPEEAVRGRGASLTGNLPLRDGEQIVAALPGSGGANAILVSEYGWVRRVRSSFFAGTLIPGTSFHEVNNGGRLAAVCWAPGDADLFIVTRQGLAVRFSESQVSGRAGALGLRVSAGDAVIAVTPVYEESGVFIGDAAGQGTIRLMSGFRPNKSPGAGGKQAMKCDAVVGAVTITPADDLFLISSLGKIIRFSAGDVPPKESAVQGVSCMSLRADTTTAIAAARL